jgi:hypothetical protein
MKYSLLFPPEVEVEPQRPDLPRRGRRRSLQLLRRVVRGALKALVMLVMLSGAVAGLILGVVLLDGPPPGPPAISVHVDTATRGGVNQRQ